MSEGTFINEFGKFYVTEENGRFDVRIKFEDGRQEVAMRWYSFENECREHCKGT